jgi:hypothetical protein
MACRVVVLSGEAGIIVAVAVGVTPQPARAAAASNARGSDTRLGERPAALKIDAVIL